MRRTAVDAVVGLVLLIAGWAVAVQRPVPGWELDLFEAIYRHHGDLAASLAFIEGAARLSRKRLSKAPLNPLGASWRPWLLGGLEDHLHQRAGLRAQHVVGADEIKTAAVVFH